MQVRQTIAMRRLININRPYDSDCVYGSLMQRQSSRCYNAAGGRCPSRFRVLSLYGSTYGDTLSLAHVEFGEDPKRQHIHPPKIVTLNAVDLEPLKVCEPRHCRCLTLTEIYCRQDRWNKGEEDAAVLLRFNPDVAKIRQETLCRRFRQTASPSLSDDSTKRRVCESATCRDDPSCLVLSREQLRWERQNAHNNVMGKCCIRHLSYNHGFIQTRECGDSSVSQRDPGDELGISAALKSRGDADVCSPLDDDSCNQTLSSVVDDNAVYRRDQDSVQALQNERGCGVFSSMDEVLLVEAAAEAHCSHHPSTSFQLRFALRRLQMVIHRLSPDMFLRSLKTVTAVSQITPVSRHLGTALYDAVAAKQCYLSDEEIIVCLEFLHTIASRASFPFGDNIQWRSGDFALEVLTGRNTPLFGRPSTNGPVEYVKDSRSRGDTGAFDRRIRAIIESVGEKELLRIMEFLCRYHVLSAATLVLAMDRIYVIVGQQWWRLKGLGSHTEEVCQSVRFADVVTQLIARTRPGALDVILWDHVVDNHRCKSPPTFRLSRGSDVPLSMMKEVLSVFIDRVRSSATITTSTVPPRAAARLMLSLALVEIWTSLTYVHAEHNADGATGVPVIEPNTCRDNQATSVWTFLRSCINPETLTALSSSEAAEVVCTVTSAAALLANIKSPRSNGRHLHKLRCGTRFSEDRRWIERLLPFLVQHAKDFALQRQICLLECISIHLGIQHDVAIDILVNSTAKAASLTVFRSPVRDGYPSHFEAVTLDAQVTVFGICRGDNTNATNDVNNRPRKSDGLVNTLYVAANGSNDREYNERYMLTASAAPAAVLLAIQILRALYAVLWLTDTSSLIFVAAVYPSIVWAAEVFKLCCTQESKCQIGAFKWDHQDANGKASFGDHVPLLLSATVEKLRILLDRLVSNQCVNEIQRRRRSFCRQHTDCGTYSFSGIDIRSRAMDLEGSETTASFLESPSIGHVEAVYYLSHVIRRMASIGQHF